jgi:hypothetical protein
VRTASIALMVAVRTSETPLFFSEATQHCIPEDYCHYTRRHENLNSHGGKELGCIKQIYFEQLYQLIQKILHY